MREQKRLVQEMRVGVEKILRTVLHEEAHEPRVTKVIETLLEAPEGCIGIGPGFCTHRIYPRYRRQMRLYRFHREYRG